MKRFAIQVIWCLLFCFLSKEGKPVNHINFGQKEVVNLSKNTWDFYYGRTYAEVTQNPRLKLEQIIVPGNWDYLGHSAFGYATYVYRFTHNLKKGDYAALRLFNIGTSYDLFINGKKLKAVGQFATTQNLSKPEFNPGVQPFEITRDTIEIAIQVSNYDYREGGIWFTPSMGLLDDLEELRDHDLFIDSFLVGSLFVLFCYFISYYFINTKNKSSLYFSLTCLFALLRIASTGDILIRQINVHYPWPILVRTEYISFMLMLLFGVLYLASLFPKDLNKTIIAIIVWVQSLLTAFFVFIPIKFSSYVIPYYLLFCVGILIYLLILISKALIAKRTYSNWVAGAFLMVFFAGLNDMLHSQAIIKTFYMMPIGIFLFSIIQAIILTKMFSNAFQEIERLSKKLKGINLSQKEVIQERTALLNMQAQELLKSNQIKDKVFSIVSHDLRAPIKSLSTVLMWMAEDDLTIEELRKSLTSINKNVDSLNLTLENLLHWSRCQLDGVKSEPELIDIRKPVQDIVELFKIQVAEKSIHLKNDVVERQTVFIDPHHLNLVLRNLVSNAIKFTKHGGTIAINAIQEDAFRVKVVVADNGIGMDKEAIDKVFSPIEHYTTYGTNNEKGTGLGLLLCKEYIETNHGKIWIESEPNVGTKICFSLLNHPNS